SSKMKRIIQQTQMMKRSVSTTSAAVTGLGAAMSTTSAVGVAAAGALGASFAAAGAGAVAYGVVATSALTKVFDASTELEKIQEKIDKADTVKERIAAQKELASLYKGMSKAQRGALTDLQEFKSFWGGFVKQFEQPIFKAFSEGLDATQKIFTKLTPTISNTAAVVTELMQSFNKSLDSASASKFFDWLNTNASESLYNFAKMAGNTLAGVGSLLQAFAPLGASFEESLVRMTQRFREWSASLSQSKGFKTFIDYVKTNGPTLMNILTNVVNSVGNIVIALAPLGPVVLKAAEGLSSFIEKASSSKELVLGLAGAILGVKAAMVTLTIVKTVTTLIGAFTNAIKIARTATLLFSAALYANPIGLVTMAILGLVAAAILIYKNWDKIKAKTIELWNKFGVLRGILLNLPGPFGKIVSAGIRIMSNWDSIRSKAASVFGAVGNWIDGVKAKFNGFVSAVKSFKMPNFKMPSMASTKAGMGPSKKDKSSYHGESYVPRNGMMYRLHQGERVLTKKENRQFAKGSGSSVIINLNGTTIREDADVEKLAASLARQIYLAGEAGA
ncbi:hypothetical protein, partial [Priestia megaterium]|uniref:hypothetical protein n=1 Tax=Priestia megaterium TaxID=1404 RepID=UPI0038B24131